MARSPVSCRPWLEGTRAVNDPVVAFDFGRMFLGDEPPLFLLEIAIRTVIIYATHSFLSAGSEVDPSRSCRL